MSILYEERASDSPYLEKVTHGWTTGDGTTIRPSEDHWHMVFARHNGRAFPIFVGPLTTSGVVSYGAGAEVLWIQFRLGTYMPHLPPRDFLDLETPLPEAAGQSFWLKGSTWELPDFDNVDTFVERLVREGVLVCDPVVKEALAGHPPPAIAPRTLRHRFLRATGLTQGHLFQSARARQAQVLLRQGTSILDTVFQAGYFDQPHLTRALKHYLGQTPAEIARQVEPG